MSDEGQFPKEEIAACLTDLCTLLGEKERWTQRKAAADKTGRPVKILSQEAVKWCALGGAYKVIAQRHPEWDKDITLHPLFDDLNVLLNTKALNVLSPDYQDFAGISYYNDHHTYEETISLLRDLEAEYRQEMEVHANN